MNETKYLNIHTSSDKESFTIYGCGKFSETKKTITKAEACLLYIELYKWMGIHDNIIPWNTVRYIF